MSLDAFQSGRFRNHGPEGGSLHEHVIGTTLHRDKIRDSQSIVDRDRALDGENNHEFII